MPPPGTRLTRGAAARSVFRGNGPRRGRAGILARRGQARMHFASGLIRSGAPAALAQSAPRRPGKTKARPPMPVVGRRGRRPASVSPGACGWRHGGGPVPGAWWGRPHAGRPRTGRPLQACSWHARASRLRGAESAGGRARPGRTRNGAGDPAGASVPVCGRRPQSLISVPDWPRARRVAAARPAGPA